MTATPDVTLLLDMDGTIREVTLAGSASREMTDAWVGRPWAETVDSSGSSKVTRMVADARSIGISAFRQITQRFPSGLELPMEYTTVLLGGRAGMLAVGKNLQAVAELQSRLIVAQQAMERDYWKLREVETRYRLLFDASKEAVMLVKAANMRILEANPAALQALGIAARAHGDIISADLLSIFAENDRPAVSSMLARAQENGKAPAIRVHLGDAGDAWMVRASLMTTDGGLVLMLQFNDAGTRPLAERSKQVSVEQLIESSPDGFAVVDREGVILWANAAFLGLIDVGAASSVLGEKLSRWLSRPGADAGVLLSNVDRHGSVRLFSSTIVGELGNNTDVEISAAVANGSASTVIGLTIRNISLRLPSSPEGESLLVNLNSVIDQVGKTPLRRLVRDTVSIVENHYISAALELANGNRTAAAELLGLSRQSLYAKLDRYDLSDQETSASKTG